ncbi:hypothetical protein RB195_005514 [Necator americanus]|uniref:Uncharacterized protein n=2 Tax=Necator americanus TaxID=51031 RepID=W2SN25_NECAM|nr:hypothetical protein NECAME_01060 [Necator americanus]ETN70112.1 hypothetical protein NECAME_01060 [Necator americanus]
MLSACINIFLLAILTLTKEVRSAPTSPAPSVFILPVQHVREVQNGYLTFKDHQLGSESAESADVTPANCVPRDSPEGIARLHIINKQLAEEAAAKGEPLTAEKTTDDLPQPATTEVDTPAEPIGEESGNVPEEPSRPPFNDTSSFDGVDVGETVELRIYKPLCDY